MIARLSFCLIVMLPMGGNFLLASRSENLQTTSGAAYARHHDVTWDHPSEQTYDAMPLGNGRMGILVSATADGKIRLVASHVDAWSEAHRLLKLGIVTVTLTPNPFGAEFEQRLHLDKGLITLKGANGFEAELRVDANLQVFCLDARADHPFSMDVALESWRSEAKLGTRKVKEGNMVGMPGGLLESGDVILPDHPGVIAWYHRNQPNHHRREAFKLHEIEPLLEQTPDLLENRTFGGWICGKHLKTVGPENLKSVPATEQSLHLHTLNQQTPSAEAWVKAIAKTAQTTPDAQTRTAHLTWWSEFWNQSWIEASGAPDADVVSRGYAHVMTMNALAGRGELPLQWNGSIFSPDPRTYSTTYHGGKAGPNADPDWRNWGNLMLHQNTRLPYYAMLAAGQAAFTRPYLAMYTRGLALMRAHTQAVFGHDGTFFREAMTLWGLSSPGCYGFDRQGLKPGQQRNVWHRTHWQGGLEVAHFMADYYAYTQDEAFAREQLIPLADQVVRFFDHHWPHRNGKLYFPHVFAMETFRDTDNPMPLVAGMHAVVKDLLSLPHHLTTADQRTYWLQLQTRLPEIPMRQREGKTILANADIVRDRKVNAEVSELYAVFPYHLYGVGLPDLEVAQDTWHNRTVVVDDVGGANPGWARGHLRGGWRQEAVMAAMAGMTDTAREEVSWALGRVVTDMRYPGFLATTYDWVPDVQHGGMAATALQQMLLQEVDDKIILLPAWPKDWDVDFKLHARKKTVVQGRLESGHLTSLRVTPQSRARDVFVGQDLKPVPADTRSLSRK